MIIQHKIKWIRYWILKSEDTILIKNMYTCTMLKNEVDTGNYYGNLNWAGLVKRILDFIIQIIVHDCYSLSE